MTRLTTSLFLGCLLGLTGCPGDDSAGDTANDGASSTGEGSSGGSMTTPGTSTDPTAGSASADSTGSPPGTTTGDPPGTTTGDPPGTTTGDPPGTDSGGSDSGGMGSICDPAGDDDACAMCVKSNCCMALEACDADGDAAMGCNCYQACIDAGGGPIGDCDMTCGVNPFAPGSVTAALAQCTIGMCGMDCPLG